MCGLIAAVSKSSTLEPAIRKAMKRMHRRGPDGEGFWNEDGVYLGHRRLAVLDLDERASQPMHSACGRYVMVFNGEIYNFRDLRDHLNRQGVVFRTTSDTETILALFAAEGAMMLHRLRGMFAFVIWDRKTKRAFAARDPYGIKPLYIATTSEGVVLGSQVKALLATGLVSHEPDPRGQAGFWLLGSVPEPDTWYRNIKAIPAGHSTWILDGHARESECWSDIGAAWREVPEPTQPSKAVAEQVHDALRQSVARHLVADVPIGVFLSGGIDSGCLAGLMSETGLRDIEGVTIAYDEYSGTGNDEAPSAAAIAAHYGIRHYIRRITRDEFAHDLPRILDAMDQPSIDGINTWYASKAAAERGLKVVLSGVGGDELFQGYTSFKQLPRLVNCWRMISRVPGVPSLGKLAGNLRAKHSGNSRWRYAAKWAQSIPGAWLLRRSLYAPDDLGELMGAELAAEALRDFDAARWVNAMCGTLPLDAALALSQIESSTYLRNQLLRDSDWASMDHSVELRTPLVDAHLLQGLQPFFANFAQFPNKTLLATAARKSLPENIAHKPKTGFGIPLSQWLHAGSHAGVSTSNSRSWAIHVAKAYEDNCAR